MTRNSAFRGDGKLTTGRPSNRSCPSIRSSLCRTRLASRLFSSHSNGTSLCIYRCKHRQGRMRVQIDCREEGSRPQCAGRGSGVRVLGNRNRQINDPASAAIRPLGNGRRRHTDRSSNEPRGSDREGGLPSGGAPPDGKVSGTAGGEPDGCERPDAGPGVGFTSRTGRSQSVPIDRPASEVGDNMANTMPGKAENLVNARAFCPGNPPPIRSDWQLCHGSIA